VLPLLQLSIITLRLFSTMIELNCEEVMFQLIFKLVILLLFVIRLW